MLDLSDLIDKFYANFWVTIGLVVCFTVCLIALMYASKEFLPDPLKSLKNTLKELFDEFNFSKSKEPAEIVNIIAVILFGVVFVLLTLLLFAGPFLSSIFPTFGERTHSFEYIIFTICFVVVTVFSLKAIKKNSIDIDLLNEIEKRLKERS